MIGFILLGGIAGMFILDSVLNHVCCRGEILRINTIEKCKDTIEYITSAAYNTILFNHKTLYKSPDEFTSGDYDSIEDMPLDVLQEYDCYLQHELDVLMNFNYTASLLTYVKPLIDFNYNLALEILYNDREHLNELFQVDKNDLFKILHKLTAIIEYKKLNDNNSKKRKLNCEPSDKVESDVSDGNENIDEPAKLLEPEEIKDNQCKDSECECQHSDSNSDDNSSSDDSNSETASETSDDCPDRIDELAENMFNTYVKFSTASKVL